jgi:hypothetical protein
VKPRLLTTLAQERGTLTARATVEDPDVRLDAEPGDAPTLTIEEGGVTVTLAFPNTDCVRRFTRRVGRVRVPDDDDDGPAAA